MAAKKSAKKSSKNKIIKNVSKNAWTISTVILALALILTLTIGPKTCGATIISEDIAAQKVIDFAAGQGVTSELVGVSDTGSLYEVILSIEGQDVPVYITKDGKTLVPQPIPLDETGNVAPAETQQAPAATNIPTADSPSSELFIWSYCPYGVTALAPFAEVAKLLGDSSNFKVNLYYAGHGDFELQQNQIQSCIQDLGYNEEYWDYAIGFSNTIYENCYGDATCDLTESTALMDSLGIDSTKVLSCVATKGEALYQADYARAQELGVTGSPTLTVNGVKADVARTADAYKTAICGSYTSSPTAECGETLSTTATTTSGSC